jgi:hypothetical protein
MAVTTGWFLNDVLQLAFVVDLDADTVIEQNVRGGPTRLLQLFVDNSGNAGASTFVKLWDSVAATAGTTDPDYQFEIAGGARITLGFREDDVDGQRFLRGLCVGASTLGGTQTGSDPAANVILRMVCT